MRQSFYSVLMALALVASACGGFDNTPFRTGNVRGRLTEADPNVARVSLVGNPGVSCTVEADGRFLLKRVPAGPKELFIVATQSKAVRLPVVVPGGGSARLEDVEPREAGFLNLQVKAPSRLGVAGGRVSVTGTPFEQLELADDGVLRVGPLPAGCYLLETSVSGFRVDQTEACVEEREVKKVKIELSKKDEDLDDPDCAVAGCERGSYCLSDGRCVECLSNDQCAPGLTCRNERCEGPGAPCAPCDGDWKCRTGASCEVLPEGSAACVARCDARVGCSQGFTCQEGRCLPAPAQLAGCTAYQHMGAPCGGDESCRARGITQGLCVEKTCTYRCTANTECPEGFACTPSEAGALCRPNPAP
ncbi:carboxypeptidase regulatory-like domain-containing protein [Archangium violaceum]|uniref:carboxypeptidase regulatory-like domain-containing protein n=1 Tax=Archangium violaceum TaxID=83451 RepID=UPI00193C0A38|nr:carboxypeptidase regulatory-like domain-containing protein [Archangium violaceum]QRK05120.1 carboxypeptidase regulatory-like domain-containing protein [Archangium violaceum]